MKIFIGYSRPIGEICKHWAKENLPHGVVLTDDMEQADIFISVLYDKILTGDYLKKLRGAYNFHPGKLPEYRGSATYSWAHINEEKQAGITLHKIDAGIDTGDIIECVMFPVKETVELTFKEAEMNIFAMFRRWFKWLVLDDEVLSYPQEGTGHTYYRKDLDSAKNLTKYVQAFTFEGKERAYFINSEGKKIYLNYYGPPCE
jgi:methionyl-tRNA formyltransferase